MKMIEINHLSKRFGHKQVLQDLSFSVPKGSVVGFVGENGAGKTTTMKAILGLLPIDEGEITVCGEPVQFGSTKTNRWIGYLPDVPQFYSFMTAVEYLTFCGKIQPNKESFQPQRVMEVLELVGLEASKQKIAGFSRGMKQRLGLAQALINRPAILICDEPTSALDPLGRKAFLDVLEKIKEETTVLFFLSYSRRCRTAVRLYCDFAQRSDPCVRNDGFLKKPLSKNRLWDCLYRRR
jgi:ABC-2 type transport system ATP-binding protein